MMFFQKLFRKDHRYYQERGDRLVAEERYADARHAFFEARRRLQKDSPADATLDALLAERIAHTGNKLATLNIVEAEHALSQGEIVKAHEHLTLATQLAEDASIREKAGLLLQSPPSQLPQPPPSPHHGTSCSSCTPSHHKLPENNEIHEEDLSPEDRFDLLLHTLPDELQERYASLGEKFACAYLLHHEGRDNESLALYEELLSEGENDILLHEKAILLHKQGRLPECEAALNRAMALNRNNPLCHMGYVQLLIDTERFSQALDVLHYVIDVGMLKDEAILIKGDVLQLTGQHGSALETYALLLSDSKAKKAAAERMVALLESEGRPVEAQALFKRYLKGCC